MFRPRIAVGSSATLTLADYGRVARQTTRNPAQVWMHRLCVNLLVFVLWRNILTAFGVSRINPFTESPTTREAT